MRINKYLSEAGVCSRREADRQIAAGQVTIDGVTASMGDQVEPGQTVCYQGNIVSGEEERILLAVNKPAGIICSCVDQKGLGNDIVSFLNYPKRIYPIGRLDKDSTGLILMTNQGDLVNRIMRASNRHEKEYLVTVDHGITDDFLEKMRRGIYLKELKQRTRPCKIEQTGERDFRIILTQGLNRQIRRMCIACGYKVCGLHRVRIMNILLGDLKPGTYRNVTGQEWEKLQQMLRGKDSKNQ